MNAFCYFKILPFIFACSLFSYQNVSAQILNAESLRKVSDTSGFSGAGSANFALKRNANEIILLASSLHIQYKNNNHLALFKGDFSFQKVEDNDFDNAGIAHIRYNYKLTPSIAWEAFSQAQYNRVNLIESRVLLGSGPRFKLSTSEKYKLFLGTLAMFEYEEVADGITGTLRDMRGSAYFSFSLYPKENLSIISTTYYQPKFAAFEDYRISSQTALAVGLFSDFSLKIGYTFTYDAFPAIGIPNSLYDFTTGIAYTFD